MPTYARPTTLGAALDLLAASPLTVLAGGTDVYPARVGRGLDEDVLDIGGIADLRGIRHEDGGWRIGAATSWAELTSASLPPMFDGLRAAAAEIGGLQIQNAGTLGGNLCNASPAADGIPVLMALDAEVELVSVRGRRRLKVADFVLGNRTTARRQDELVVALHVGAAACDVRSVFLKLGARRYLVISIVMVAAVVELADGRVTAARIAVGACGAAACRLPLLERRLCGQGVEADWSAAVDETVLAPLSPIDDVRGTAAYRLDACLTLLRRSLRRLAPSRQRAA